MKQQYIKALIMDKEEQSATSLNELLNSFPILNVSGIISELSGITSILEKESPQIVFLSDSLINDQNINLLNEIHQEGYSFYVIVIAENNYAAFEALKLSAIAYLTKPINKQILTQTIENAVIAIINHELHLLAHPVTNHNLHSRRYRFNSRNGFILTIPDHIVYVEADWNYSELFLINGKSEMLSMSIGHLEEILSHDNFYRINRSVIVNLNHIKKVDRKRRNCYIEISGIEKELKVAAKKIKELEIKLF